MTSSPARAAAYTTARRSRVTFRTDKKKKHTGKIKGFLSFFCASARHLRAPGVQSALLRDKTRGKNAGIFRSCCIALVSGKKKTGGKKLKTSIYLNHPPSLSVFFGT